MRKLVVLTIVFFLIGLVVFGAVFYTPLVLPRFLFSRLQDSFKNLRVEEIRIGQMATSFPGTLILRDLSFELKGPGDDVRVQIAEMIIPEATGFLTPRQRARFIVSGVDVATDFAAIRHLDGHFYVTFDARAAYPLKGLFRKARIEIPLADVRECSGILHLNDEGMELDEVISTVLNGRDRGHIHMKFSLPVRYDVRMDIHGMTPAQFNGMPSLVASINSPVEAMLYFSGTRGYADVFLLSMHLPPSTFLDAAFVRSWAQRSSSQEVRLRLHEALGEKEFLTIDRGMLSLRDWGKGEATLTLKMENSRLGFVVEDTFPVASRPETWAGVLKPPV